jgi:hypothetical protein
MRLGLRLRQSCAWCKAPRNDEVRTEVLHLVKMLGLAPGVRVCRCGQSVGQEVGVRRVIRLLSAGRSEVRKSSRLLWFDPRIERPARWARKRTEG